MPRVVTTVHDPVALAATCARLGLPPPVERAVWLDAEEVFGWMVRLGGLRHPVVCDTLTGLIAYHPLDNAFDRYAHLMRFVERFYDLRHKQLCSDSRPVPRKDRRVARLKTA